MEMDPSQRMELLRILGGMPDDYVDPGSVHLAVGGSGLKFPDPGFSTVSDRPSVRPEPQPDPYRASPFAAPGMPPLQNMPFNPNDSGLRNKFNEEMAKLPGVVDTSKLNDTPLWNGGGMSLNDVRRSHPPVAPLLEKWQREAVEMATILNRKSGMSERLARQQALRDFGPRAKITGAGLDPDGDDLPEEWGAEPGFDENGKRRFQNRSTDFMDMGLLLRRILEHRWPEGPIPEELRQELDDLLQDHQYDGQGRRLGPTSMLDLDQQLRNVYRRRAGAFA